MSRVGARREREGTLPRATAVPRLAKPARHAGYAPGAHRSIGGCRRSGEAASLPRAGQASHRGVGGRAVPRLSRRLSPAATCGARGSPSVPLSRPVPTRDVSRVGLLVDQTTEAIPANPAVGAVPGPVDDERLALDVGERDRPPEARVVALVAVVAHHEDGAGRHAVRAVVLPAAGHPARGREGGVGVVPWLPVDVDLLAPHLDRLAADGDDTLAEVL